MDCLHQKANGPFNMPRFSLSVMATLLRRARRVYREEGVRSTATKISSYIIRRTFHTLGTWGLYNSKRYISFLRWKNSGFSRYHAIADPFKIVPADPESIKYVTGRGPNPGRFQWQDIGMIADGDWDQSSERVDELPVVRALSERFEEGRNWDEIDFIQRVKREARQGNALWRGCTSEDDVRTQCHAVDNLYAAIAEHDYQSKKELIMATEEIPSSRQQIPTQFEPYDEVVVDISRDGEFLFVDGRHRLAIAKILEIDEIPVRISARHAEWQQVREMLHETPSEDVPAAVKQHLDHPDLQALIDAEKEM